MLEELKQKVYEANMELPRRNLVTYTWGNVSGIDREKGLFVIKPSGVEYEELKPEDLVVMDLKGNKVEGDMNPSSDTKTHLVLYNAFPEMRQHQLHLRRIRDHPSGHRPDDADIRRVLLIDLVRRIPDRKRSAILPERDHVLAVQKEFTVFITYFNRICAQIDPTNLLK